MELISLAAAVTLTEWSERTFWRRFADGTVKREAGGNGGGRSLVTLNSIRPYLCLPLNDEEIELVKLAGGGNAEAQNDLALIFLSNNKPKGAIYWLSLAAKQDHTEAMHWLGRCYMEGNGVPKDEDMGIMWLSRAAAFGHVISQGQMQAIRNKFTGAAMLTG